MSRLSPSLQKIFGSSLTPSGNVAVYGSLAAGSPAYSGDPKTIQSLAQYLGGFTDGVVGNNSPAIQDMNALIYEITYQIAYILQQGIPEWNTDNTYYKGGFATDGAGRVYVSLTNGNTGHALSDTNNWCANAFSQPAGVHLTGSQSVAVDGLGHKLNFGTVFSDPFGNFNAASYIYTAPVTGLYDVTCQTQVDNATGQASTMEFALRPVINAATAYNAAGWSVASPPGNRWYPRVATLVPLNAGDTLEMQLEANDTVNTGTVTVANSDFCIRLA